MRFFLISLIILISLPGCKVGSSVNDDDLLYSNKRGRPYKYGYILKKEDCDVFKELAQTAGIKNGDVVADVGASSGYIEGAISVSYDSVSFYLEDIDDDALNKKEVGKMVSYYSKLRGHPQTNTFRFVIGTIHKTNLPDGVFDDVIVYNTFHEFTYVSDMLDDIYQKLKPGGRLIIEDEFSTEKKSYWVKGCNTVAYTEQEMRKLLALHNLFLIKTIGPEAENYNVLVFGKNKSDSDRFLLKKENVDQVLQSISLLDSASVADDSIKVMAIGDSLISHVIEINDVYPLFDKYVSNFGNKWMDKGRFVEAINIYKLCLRLYPDLCEMNDLLADALIKNGKYSEAQKYYSRALKLNPDDSDAKDGLKKILEAVGPE